MCFLDFVDQHILVVAWTMVTFCLSLENEKIDFGLVLPCVHVLYYQKYITKLSNLEMVE